MVTGDVPMGATPEQAAAAIRLVMLVNDVSLRSLIPGELAKGRLLPVQPASAFSPVAVTPDELGDGTARRQGSSAAAGGTQQQALQQSPTPVST